MNRGISSVVASLGWRLRQFAWLRCISIPLALAAGCSQLCGLPSFASQTGQKCAACHVGGDWPQLTPWGRFFKLSGYTAGTPVIDKERALRLPVGVFGQAGLTWAQDANNATGGTVIPHSGVLEPYEFSAEVATKVTNFMGVFYEYTVGNTFPGWRGDSGAVDIRAVHFFYAGRHEILAAIDSNNNPTVQDVWNSSPDWSFPFYSSPWAPGAQTAPVISRLGSQSGSVGAYALIDRHVYVEGSVYRVGTGFFRWMTAGTPFSNPGISYLKGFNPYWRAYWTTAKGPDSIMVGTFGMQANVFPDAAQPTGPANSLTDSGFDAQYQHLLSRQKTTLRASYIYEARSWGASFPIGSVGTPTGDAKFLNLSGSYSLGDAWTFHAGYLLTSANHDALRYTVTDESGNTVSTSPDSTGYVLEVDRHLSQNLQLMAQYRGFLKYNGLQNKIDGVSRSASDNNTLWVSIFFGF